jgi:hypothetical protein
LVNSCSALDSSSGPWSAAAVHVSSGSWPYKNALPKEVSKKRPVPRRYHESVTGERTEVAERSPVCLYLEVTCRGPDRTTALHCLGAEQMLLQRGQRMLRPPVEAVRVLLDKRYVEHRFAFCQART